MAATMRLDRTGARVELEYSAAGELLSLRPPTRPAHVFEYSPRGWATEYGAPALENKGSRYPTIYSRDRDGLITQIAYPDGRTLTVDRLADGRPRTIDVGLEEAYQLTYASSIGQVQALDAPGGISVEIDFDGPYVASSLWMADDAEFGRVDVSRNEAFQIVGRKVNDGAVISHAYDDDGLVVRAGPLAVTRDDESGLARSVDLDSLDTAFQYNAFSELNSIAATFDGDSLFREQVVGRDAAGRILEIEQIIESERSVTTYGYDAAGRLTSVRRDGGAAAEYVYDANGNRTRQNVAGSRKDATYDARDRLESVGERHYAYNESGQLIAVTDTGSGLTWRLDYDLFGNLRSAQLPDGPLVEYDIDAMQRRVGKRVDGRLEHRLLYQDGLRPIAQIEARTGRVATFVYIGDRHVPDAMVRDDGTYRLVTIRSTSLIRVAYLLHLQVAWLAASSVVRSEREWQWLQERM